MAAMAVTALPVSTSNPAKSTHVSDPAIRPFLQPDFDPIAHLNASLPPLSQSATTRQFSSLSNSQQQNGRAVPLPELSAQLQTLLTQLNAQATRMSNALTQLTDEIIRSGGRLAYEVEVLRGETFGLTDAFDTRLKDDLLLFGAAPAPEKEAETTKEDVDDAIEALPETEGEAVEAAADTTASTTSSEPPYLDRLRTLTAVRARLDSVVKVFGEAMNWPIAPSELSLTSSLISISTSDTSNGKSLEEKGKAFSETLRAQIYELLGPEGDLSGLEAAEARVAELRLLAEVWKGTAEEKARAKLVDGLQRLVEERRKATAAVPARGVPAGLPTRGVDMRYGNPEASQGGYGFLQNLRNLKNDVYLE